MFAMARVAKDVWKEFQEVNSLCEKGSLKDQKISAGEVTRGFVSLKQWHMKPLCSLGVKKGEVTSFILVRFVSRITFFVKS